MEGNACYRYGTIARYVLAQHRPPVLTCLDIGCNVGAVSKEILDTFPGSKLWAFDVMPHLVANCKHNLRGYGDRVAVSHAAITAQHLYADDLGTQPHATRQPVKVWEGLPHAGGGWWGGHTVTSPNISLSSMYRERPDLDITTITLDELVNKLGTIDFVKTDCEGSECSFLGCASESTLKAIRWIGGEYHGLRRFYPVKEKLSLTHRVNLVGEGGLGSFFCERRDEEPGLLRDTQLQPREYPHLMGNVPITWCPFNADQVPQREWFSHGITGRTDTRR